MYYRLVIINPKTSSFYVNMNLEFSTVSHVVHIEIKTKNANTAPKRD